MPCSNSKAQATISTLPPCKVVGGSRDYSSESECVNSMRLGVINECKVNNVDSVPGSFVKKSLEKPCCGPSEQVSLPTGDYSELFSLFSLRLWNIAALLLILLLQNYLILPYPPFACRRRI